MTSSVVQAVGQRIRTRRERLRLTQRDVANGLQVSAQAVSKWERGENAPDVGVLVALSQLLGVSLDWLLGGHDVGTEGGRPRQVLEATVLVADITGFWQAATHLTERDVATWLNGRLFQITEAVVRHDGIPVKYLGDAALALFAGGQHRDRAVRAAFLARRTTETLIHIGLDCGSLYVGPVGHPDYARLDIIGQAVFGAFTAQEWAARSTESHVAATSRVLDGLADPVETVESEMVTLGRPGAPGFTGLSVFGLKLPAVHVAPATVAGI